jgi:mannose-6-phosphate isomerase-like protein (cupin superfamily)
MQPKILKYAQTKEYYLSENCFVNELSNSLNDEDVSIALVRVKPGETTKWHRLKNTTERYVILEGKGKMEMADLPAKIVSQNDVVIIPPMCRQRITNTEEIDLIFLAICSPRFNSENYETMNSLDES